MMEKRCPFISLLNFGNRKKLQEAESDVVQIYLWYYFLPKNHDQVKNKFCFIQKIAWHEPIDIPTSLAASLIGIRRFSEINLFF